MNFWDIDIAHYGAYSLYLEAIRRTDRLVHELWQHAQSLPAVPRSHDAARGPRAGTRQRRRRQRVREPPQRRRVLPARVARGGGRRRAQGRRHGTADPHRRRRPDGGAAFSGSRCRSAKAGRSRSWRSSRSAAMQFDAGLTGDAAALARAHGDVLAAPAGDGQRVHPRRAAEVAARSSRRAALPAGAAGSPLAVCRSRSWSGRSPAIARVEAEAGCRPDRASATPRGSRTRRRRCCESAAPARVAEGSRRALPDNRPGARGAALSRRMRRVAWSSRLYGSGIAVQPDKLWSRFKGAGIRVPLEPGRRAADTERVSRQALFGARDDGAHGAAGRGAGPSRRRCDAGSSSRTKRCTRCATQRHGRLGQPRRGGRVTGLSYDRLRAYRDELTRALYSKIQSGVESPQAFAAYARSLKIAPAPGALLHADDILLRLRPRRAADRQRHAVREQHVRRVGRGAGAPAGAAARPGDAVRRPRQAEAVQQPAAVLAAPRRPIRSR